MSGSSLHLGVLGDIHLSGDPGPPAAWHNAYDFDGLPGRLTRAVEEFASAPVDAICLIGDLTHHGSAHVLEPLAKALKLCDVPAWVVAGNHDTPGVRALADAVPGLTPATPAGQRVAGWRIAGLQVAPGGWFGATVEQPPAVEQWGAEPVVLLSHFPLLSHAQRLADRGMPYPGDLLGRAAIAAALTARTAPTVVLSGHIHARDSSHRDGLLQLVQGALVEAPYECSIVELTADAVTRTAVLLDGPEPSSDVPTLTDAHERFERICGEWIPRPRSSSATPVVVTANSANANSQELL